MSSISPILKIQPAVEAPSSTSASDRADAAGGPSGFADALAGTHDRPPPRRSSSRSKSAGGGADLPASGNPPPTAAPAHSAAAPRPSQAKDDGGPKNVTGTAKSSHGANGPGAAPAADAPAHGTAAPTDPAAAKAAADAAAATAAAEAATAGLLPLPQGPAVAAGSGVAAPTAPGLPVDVAASVTAAATAQGIAANGVAAAQGSAKSVVAAAATPSPSSAAGVGAAAVGPTDPLAAESAASAPTPAVVNGPAAPAPVDPAVAALLAQATAAPADAGAAKTSDSRVVDLTLQSPDAQTATVGDAASLAGASAATPALAAAAAGAAEIASAISAASADKHDKSAADALTAASQATVVAQAPAGPAPADASTPVLKVPSSVESPDFAQNVANQVSVMVDSKLTSAKLQVSPPSLGPIEVRIAIQGDHAQVSFSSHSALTRDALESSSPHLREMLGAQGFAQVSVDISHRSFQERTPTPQSYDWGVGREAIAASDGASASSGAARTGNGLLNAYA